MEESADLESSGSPKLSELNDVPLKPPSVMDIEVSSLQASAEQQLNCDISSIDGNDVTTISQSTSDHVSASGDDERNAAGDNSEGVSAGENDKRKTNKNVSEQVSASEDNEKKGSSGGEDKTTSNTSENTSTLPSRPQRCLRLNRRGFYISKLTERLASKTVASSNSKSASGTPSSNCQRKWSDFHKKAANESQIKKTNHNSIKNEQTTVTLPSTKTVYTKPKIKRNVFIRNKDVTVNIENTTSQEPPKKKYKPITWP